jgi:hypothetical protein
LVGENVIYIAWIQACIATLGSLYFSEIMHLVPCTLCWFQRIFMYPLTLILAVGILRREYSAVCVGHLVHDQADRMAWLFHDPIDVIDCLCCHHDVHDRSRTIDRGSTR